MGKGGDDVLRGGALDEYIEGNDGNDTLRGAGGNDKLRGGAGTDNMKGGGGSDLVSGQGDDLITGDAEPDVDDGYPDFVTGGAGRTTFHLTNADKYATCQDLEPDLHRLWQRRDIAGCEADQLRRGRTKDVPRPGRVAAPTRIGPLAA